MSNVLKFGNAMNERHVHIIRKPFPPENAEYNSQNVKSAFLVDVCINFEDVNSTLVVSMNKVTAQDIMKYVLNYFTRTDELDRVFTDNPSELEGLWYRGRINGTIYGIVGITEIESRDVDTMLKYCSAVPFEGLNIEHKHRAVDIE